MAGILPGAEELCRHIEDFAVGRLGHSPGSLLWKPHSMAGSALADARGVAGGESCGQTTMPAFEKSLCGSTARVGSSPYIPAAVWNGEQTLTVRGRRNILLPMYRLEGQNLPGYRWYLGHGLQYLLSCLRPCRMTVSYATESGGCRDRLLQFCAVTLVGSAGSRSGESAVGCRCLRSALGESVLLKGKGMYDLRRRHL